MLYTTLPHFDVISVSNNIIEFAFRTEGNKKYIDFSENRAFWYHKLKHLHFFAKNSLQITVQHLIKCCYCEVGNLTTNH